MYIALQLHITGKCNLRCKHCYIEEHAKELSYKEVKRAIKQFNSLIRRMKKVYHENVFSQLRITGGEPFLHKDILKILRLARRTRHFVVIMSNGTVFNKDIFQSLKRIERLQAVQVSMDGKEDTHDRLRGNGNFKKVIQGLDLLNKHGIPTRVSFTAHLNNYKEFPDVAEVCREKKVATLWSDRYIPFHDNPIKAIDAEHMEDYISVLREVRYNAKNENAGLFVENYRALQFIGSADTPYSCKAGEALITVDEHGDIMPCRRLPIVCGNINNTNLRDVYFKNACFRELREHKVDERCQACKYVDSCKGGARCMSYATSDDYISADPGCFLTL
ncbi:MAG: radical SAM protein [Agathobacter sp.]|nr:radical SAM protein [Agathobacter sp.]